MSIFFSRLLVRRSVAGLFGVAIACAASAASVAPDSRHAAAAASRLRVFGAPMAALRPAALSRLDGALAEVALRYGGLERGTMLQALHRLNPAARFRLSSPLAIPQVLIDAVSRDNPQALASALEGLGLEHPAVYSNDVGGWLPVDQLAAAAALPQLHHLRASMPRSRAGVVTSQGDFVTHADVLRSANTLSGSGVTVGVLSDSFNCYAVYAASGVPASGTGGYAQSGFTANAGTDATTGDLPAKVNVLKEADCLNYGAPVQLPFTDEGRAMLQIVHDLAPDAGLAFYTAFNSEADFANGILALATAGAKVIDDDVGYPDEPFFQDGLLAQAIDQVESHGVAYFSSAGNDSTNSYENTAPSFPVASSSAPNAGEQLLNFAGGQAPVTALPLTIAPLLPGEFLFLILEWDQPYVTGAPGSPGSANALDLCVSSSSGTSCTGPNALGADPVQVLVLGNPADAGGNTASENLSISIGLAAGPAPGRVKFVLADDGAGSTINSFATLSPTIQGHPGAAGAAAVGAAPYFFTPACGVTPAELEPLSSVGGEPILFDSSGKPLAAPVVRQKPDFVGPDGVSNTFLGFPFGQSPSNVSACANNLSYPDFFGTSAAAPHAAAIAALLLQAKPTQTPQQIYDALSGTALPMPVNGAQLNYSAGHGLIQAAAALSGACSGGLNSGGTGGGESTVCGGKDPPGGGSLSPWILFGLAVLLIGRIADHWLRPSSEELDKKPIS